MIRNIYSWFCWIKKEKAALSLLYIDRCMQRQSHPAAAGARILIFNFFKTKKRVVMLLARFFRMILVIS